MRRQWNRCLIDEDPEWFEVMEDGTARRGLRFLYSDDDIEMIRQGYKCIECGEVLEAAFPDSCFLCGYPVKERQAERFGEVYRGWRPTGSQIDWDQEEEDLDRQRHERETRQGLKTKGIWVPGSE